MRMAGLAVLLGLGSAALAAEPAINYPKTEKGDVSYSAFGITVADPYRWLETDVRTDPKVRVWVDEENKVTQSYLATLPQRAAIKARLTELWNFEKYRVPVKRGGRYFFDHNSGLQNQYVLMVQDGLDGPPRQLLDPNGWSADGATALAEWRPSHDGKKLIYTIQDGGTDWRIVKVLDVDTAKPMADEVRWVKHSDYAWRQDGSGFFYSRFPEPKQGAEFQSTNLNQQIYFHKLGSPQSDDRLIYETPDKPKYTHLAQVTDDDRYLLIYTREGTDARSLVSLIDLKDASMKPRPLVDNMKDFYELAGSVGDRLYFVTDNGAPRNRLVSVDVSQPGLAKLDQVIAEGKSAISGASLIGGKLVVDYLEDAKSAIYLYDLKGQKLSNVALPGIGSVAGLEGDENDPETFFSFSSYATPPSVFRLDTASGQATLFKQPAVPFDPSHYVVEQVFYPSKDGTKVPMFITRRKDLDMSKPHPTLLYAYGGFNIPSLPAFNAARLGWVEMGGVFAVANIRGGSEYGKDWHDGGRLLKKQNVFDDFIAAGETLIQRKITTKKQLAVQGGSNGGLLIGAVVNQRPDLFAAALPQVGVMDMMRYNLFTAGRYWTDDYGDPAEEVHFKNLLTYSPYHNIRDGKMYPAILATTADTDDRVIPGHSFKYAAALQAAKIGPKPHLIRIETRAGHGSGKPTDKIIEEYSDMWAFIGHFTGLEGEHS